MQGNGQIPTAGSLRATEAQFRQFVQGMTAVLHQWTALLLVAQHCDAAAVKTMQESLVTWHQRDGEVYADEMELFFDDFFSETRSVSIEDDSMKEVSDVLHDMYRRCCQDDFSTVQRYVQSAQLYKQMNPLAQCVQLGGAFNTVDDNDEDDDEEEGDGDEG